MFKVFAGNSECFGNGRKRDEGGDLVQWESGGGCGGDGVAYSGYGLLTGQQMARTAAVREKRQLTGQGQLVRGQRCQRL